MIVFRNYSASHFNAPALERINTPPTPKALGETLKKASQLWIISDSVKKLNEAHFQVIKAFFDSGKGIYIWGDNEPYYADANYLVQESENIQTTQPPSQQLFTFHAKVSLRETLA